MEQFKIDNLNKLADYLEEHVQETQFDMSGYRMHKPKCGTVACAIGWSPDAIPEIRVKYGPKYDWLEIAEYFVNRSDDDYSWTWCFSGAWTGFDNTVKGAVRRLRYLAHHHRPPPWFNREMLDKGGMPDEWTNYEQPEELH